MNLLLEDAVKERLRRRGVEVPDGRVASTADEVREIAASLGGTCMVKALVGVGDRGRKGLVVRAAHPEAAGAAAAGLFGQEFELEVIERVLVEQEVTADDDHYVGFTIDGSRAEAVLLLGPGGSGVEQRSSPPRISVQLHRDGLADVDVPEVLAGVVAALFAEFLETGARLIELNPVRVVDGKAIVLDGKAVLDPYLPPTADSHHIRVSHHDSSAPRDADDQTAAGKGGSKLNYIEFDGDIGLIMWGGGASLVILDALHDRGLQPANYADFGGGAGVDDRRIELTERVLAGRHRGVLIAAARLTEPVERQALMFRDALERHGYVGGHIPVVVRLGGKDEQRGREIFDLPGITYVGGDTPVDDAVHILADILDAHANRVVQ